jgi:hypothetical protein
MKKITLNCNKYDEEIVNKIKAIYFKKNGRELSDSLLMRTALDGFLFELEMENK